ncbi:MAG: bifunctional homocysteine S-methyltransferase/methylenetetrahydrofolate reductase [Thermoflavifilum sp.]|nr:bifunctional homocysteine S-methyltransferase/methylenetetrahydrofolate reductase [Thermoflavifilum sp.]MCL6514569.1 bifunctional homocysteine S-methyltransferase/methylenetetrahydrofolate reductase [Alicyclobacillus sp.]
MPQHDFLRRLRHGEVVLGDGAMATLLHQSGVTARTCLEALCLDQPAWVGRVHRAYVAAGAELIQTHTFGAHRLALERFGEAARTEDINRAAVAVARAAAGDAAWVFGTVGPVRDQAAPRSEALTAEEISEVAAEQIRVLVSEGVDGLILETFADLEEMLVVLRVARSITPLPIIANLSPLVVGVTRDGIPVADAFQALRDEGAEVTGLNCRLGPAGILRSFERLPQPWPAPLAAVPNAGLLQMQEGDVGFTGSADYFADVMMQLVALGARFIGGCCGTTPAYIACLRERLAQSPTAGPGFDLQAHRARPAVRLGETPVHPREQLVDVDSPLPSTRTLPERVREEVTVLVELDPPRTLDVRRFFEGAAALKEAGADYLTLADNSLASVRVSNMALAAQLARLGIETIVHVTCRDRNLIGQQSHLMGLHVLGIRHVLLVTGDPSRFGELPGATPVYDTSSMELTRMVKRLNEGIAFSGQPMREPAQFVVGTAFNPHVAQFDKALERLRRKVEAGADFVMTQPVFDPQLMERIARAAETVGVPVFIGIMPLVSARNAWFLHHEVPGIRIPEPILARMAEAPSEQAAEEGLRIATELVDHALTLFRGIYLITPFLRYRLTAALARYVRDHARRATPETA